MIMEKFSQKISVRSVIFVVRNRAVHAVWNAQDSSSSRLEWNQPRGGDVRLGLPSPAALCGPIRQTEGPMEGCALD